MSMESICIEPMSMEPEPPDDGCARENASCSTVWTATRTPTINGNPRSRPARHQSPRPVPATPAINAQPGTSFPDIMT
ncbi:hypothetical protein ACWDBW_02050 [Streptomyces sp. NPDC001107]